MKFSKIRHGCFACLRLLLKLRREGPCFSVQVDVGYLWSALLPSVCDNRSGSVIASARTESCRVNRR